MIDYNSLVRSYNALSYTKQLRELMYTIYNTSFYENKSKLEIVRKINKEILSNYQGEQVLKYKLAKEFYKKNYIAAFEVKVNSSRTDFLVINGHTKSFEIKSKIDTLNRLKKQTSDYGRVFEYNTVLIDICHLEKVIKLIPEYYGIWYFNGNKKVIHRQPTLSPNINSLDQLNLFTKKELHKYFQSSDQNDILLNYLSNDINENFKLMLKERYKKRWSFIKNNWHDILPIDLQFFFNSNLSPHLVYNG